MQQEDLAQEIESSLRRFSFDEKRAVAASTTYATSATDHDLAQMIHAVGQVARDHLHLDLPPSGYLSEVEELDNRICNAAYRCISELRAEQERRSAAATDAAQIAQSFEPTEEELRNRRIVEQRRTEIRKARSEEYERRHHSYLDELARHGWRLGDGEPMSFRFFKKKKNN